MSGDKSAAELAAEVKATFQQALDDVKGKAEEALGKAKAGETLTTSFKEQVDEALTKMNGLKAQLDELEQKAARGGNGDGVEHKSFGQQFVDADGVKNWLASDPSSGRAELRLKATLTTSDADAAGSVLSLIHI